MQIYEENYLYHALNIGEQMLMCGAEVARVEDTVSRICMAYGACRADVVTITSSIIATVYDPQMGMQTQTRRIHAQSTDLHRLARLNDLSRKICASPMPLIHVQENLEEILGEPGYSQRLLVAAYAMISGVFTVFFGGTLPDMLVSMGIGIFLRYMQTYGQRLRQNPFFMTFIYSAAGGFLANLSVLAGLGENVDKISIGNIMLFIPGLLFTNSIRDMFSGDTITGLTKFVESILLAIVIAIGFTLTNFMTA